jgi:hypothetical protein
MRHLIVFAGFIFTSGFFAHDIHYTLKFIGVSLTSLFFLIGLFWFHILVFLKESGAGVIDSAKANKTILVLRLIIITLSIVSCLKEHFSNTRRPFLLTLENIIEGLISIILVVFPEIMFKLLFHIKGKRDAMKSKDEKKAVKFTSNDNCVIENSNPPSGNPLNTSPDNSVSRVHRA